MPTAGGLYALVAGESARGLAPSPRRWRVRGAAGDLGVVGGRGFRRLTLRSTTARSQRDLGYLGWA